MLMISGYAKNGEVSMSLPFYNDVCNVLIVVKADSLVNSGIGGGCPFHITVTDGCLPKDVISSEGWGFLDYKCSKIQANWEEDEDDEQEGNFCVNFLFH